MTKSWLKGIWEKVDAYGGTIEVGNIKWGFTREGDEWIMNIFEECGYSLAELERLNRVRLHQQVIFWSDVLGANGKTIDRRYLSQRLQEEEWSTITFPQERPPRKDFKLWKEALVQARSHRLDRLGRFLDTGHKIWNWRYCEASNSLLHMKESSMDIYFPSTLPGHRRANRYTRQVIDAPKTEGGVICTVDEVAMAVVALRSSAEPIRERERPSGFLDVLREWGCTWMWDSLQLVGGEDWLAEAIADESLVAVTDGSYIKELYPNLCSAAFIFECSKGRGRLVGSFAEKTMAANAYRGELLGLMAIHLILLSVNRMAPRLQGSVHIYSDCLGALHRVKDLPPHRIPSRCRHSDILKNLLVNCSDLTFVRYFSHVKAHQDDHEDWSKLDTRQAQLNCLCDAGAKSQILEADPFNLPKQRAFPLEPICMFMGNEKMTSDTGGQIRFAAHRVIAKKVYHALGVLHDHQFEEVDWPHVYDALHGVPRLFQIWACKQVMDIAPTNNFLKWDGRDPWCPCCLDCRETTAHILDCEESGRVEALLATADELDNWLDETDTDPLLADCIIDFVRGRGGRTMAEIQVDLDLPSRFDKAVSSQDTIGWRRMLEGMISKEFAVLQKEYWDETGATNSLDKWAEGLIVRLLEITHGQWIYRNYVVHDRVSGALATARKEEIQAEIEKQQELGATELLEEDKYLLEVNLGDLETSSGERQEYWLLAIRSARKAWRIKDNASQPARRRTTRERAYDSTIPLFEVNSGS